MLASEWELRFGVIEILAIDFGGLPIKRGVTTGALSSQAALMLVLVAVDATRCQAEPGAIEIFAGKQCARLRGNVLSCVAGTAVNAGVFAIKVVAGLGVIEAARSRIPMHHLKIGAVVIGVAFDTCGARNRGARKGGVQAAILLEFVRDFLVAISATERRRSRGDRVTFGAVGAAVETLMGAGERTGRDLCMACN